LASLNLVSTSAAATINEFVKGEVKVSRATASPADGQARRDPGARFEKNVAIRDLDKRASRASCDENSRVTPNFLSNAKLSAAESKAVISYLDLDVHNEMIGSDEHYFGILVRPAIESK
jgi:hypothetical protein